MRGDVNLARCLRPRVFKYEGQGAGQEFDCTKILSEEQLPCAAYRRQRSWCPPHTFMHTHEGEVVRVCGGGERCTNYQSDSSSFTVTTANTAHALLLASEHTPP